MIQAFHYGGPKDGEFVPLKWATPKVMTEVDGRLHEYILVEKDQERALYRHSEIEPDATFKVAYRGFDIEVFRENCLGGWEMLYYSIFRRSDGYELYTSFEDSEETILTKIDQLRAVVNDHLDSLILTTDT